MDSFLEKTSPRVRVQFHTQGSSSSAEEVKIPRFGLRDVWKACEKWSCYGVEVPLSIENFNEKVKQHYVPSLSAIQIFTIKPFADDDSSSRSSVIGSDGTGTGSAKPNPYSDYKHRFLQPEHLGYLYFQYNETTRPSDRGPLTYKMRDLAEQHNGLNTLTNSDLSPYSWISIAWYPIYPIPAVNSRKELSASFLTYHSLTPCFPEKFGAGDKVNQVGKPIKPKVVLPPFAAVAYKAFGDIWIRPGTSDRQMIEMREKSASSWVETLDFTHNDLNFFMSHKNYGRRR
ncbi:unnamed protein product [Arabis nemorensis]|uniref:Uncharacterized protein n=1 Tax=Arabis nemorensis TaxID=586526 RepID=A0A565CVA9_9BRAS|nr:unnamed protein product [Arabis nemorensis]